jgi:hypothetical protein
VVEHLPSKRETPMLKLQYRKKKKKKEGKKINVEA